MKNHAINMQWWSYSPVCFYWRGNHTESNIWWAVRPKKLDAYKTGSQGGACPSAPQLATPMAMTRTEQLTFCTTLYRLISMPQAVAHFCPPSITIRLINSALTYGSQCRQHTMLNVLWTLSRHREGERSKIILVQRLSRPAIYYSW